MWLDDTLQRLLCLKPTETGSVIDNRIGSASAIQQKLCWTSWKKGELCLKHNSSVYSIFQALTVGFQKNFIKDTEKMLPAGKRFSLFVWSTECVWLNATQWIPVRKCAPLSPFVQSIESRLQRHTKGTEYVEGDQGGSVRQPEDAVIAGFLPCLLSGHCGTGMNTGGLRCGWMMRCMNIKHTERKGMERACEPC